MDAMQHARGERRRRDDLSLASPPRFAPTIAADRA